jgi:hypothetical protein
VFSIEAFFECDLFPYAETFIGSTVMGLFYGVSPKFLGDTTAVEALATILCLKNF